MSEGASACERRYTIVSLAFEEKRAGKGDLFAALRHLLRWEQERKGQSFRLVPRRPPWPSIEDWTQSGFYDVFEYDEARLQVHASAWHPEWLEHGLGDSIDVPVFAESVRRTTPPVEPDPFLPRFGFSSYKSEGQREAIRAVLSAPPGATLTVLLPTGAGKSLCAHLPALLDEGAMSGLVLVITPTVALALDQQERLRNYIPYPTAYVGGRTELELASNRAIRERILNGTQRILFTSPESVLQSLAPVLYGAAKRGLLRWFVIDEAHMVEHWGDEFRSAFQEITAVRADLLRQCSEDQFRTLLLTATLTETALDSLETLFGSPGPFRVLSAAQLRPEPAFWACYCGSEDLRVRRVLEAVQYLPRPLILYTTLVEDANFWHRTLRDAGYLRTGLMTGKTNRNDRLDLLTRWHSDELDVVVATSAFGLGVDKDNVCSVVHACVPENLDRYYQEVGRGGRDGRASISLVLYTANDLKQAKNARKIISAELGHERWRAMVQKWEPIGDGRYRVPVTVAPAYKPNAYNDYNVAWNLRTLTLMARAKVISLDSEPPPTAAGTSEMSDSEAESAFSTALQRYRDHRIIRPESDAHQSDALWENVIAPLRDRAYVSSRQSFQLMRAVLRGDGCVAESLLQLYSIEARDDRRGVPVAASCGGCRTCRNRGYAPFETEIGRPAQVWGANEHISPLLAKEFGNHRMLALFHRGFRQLSNQRALAYFVQWLAQQGVRNVVAPKRIRDLIRNRLVQFETPVFLFDQYEPLFLQPAATAIIIENEEEADLYAVLAGERKRVLLLPSDIRDPQAPHRRLQDVLSCHSFELDEFLTRNAL